MRSASPGWSLGIGAPETFLLRRREVFTKVGRSFRIVAGLRQISIGSGQAGKGRARLSWSGPGRFGPSRKKEAAARRFGNYELWDLNAGMIRTTPGLRQNGRGIWSLAAEVITAAGVTQGRKRRSKTLATAGSGG